MSDINMTIIKRDGSRVPYNNEKIQNAVAKALMASGEVATKRVSTSAQIIGLLVECELFDDPTAARNGQMEATVEHIQDLVEAALMEQGLPKTAESLYPVPPAAYEDARDPQRDSRREEDHRGLRRSQ